MATFHFTRNINKFIPMYVQEHLTEIDLIKGKNVKVAFRAEIIALRHVTHPVVGWTFLKMSAVDFS